MSRRPGAGWLGPLGLLCLLACQAPPPAEAPAAPDAREVRRLARHLLEDARALRREGRLDAAERVARRGLAVDPKNAALERELANVLDARGRPSSARAERARADAIDPPPPPLPTGPAATGDGATLVLLARTTADLRLDQPGRWPDDAVTSALAERVRVRLPGASLLRSDPESLFGAGRWLADRDAARVLSLRVDRADCRFSVKDGAIAVAELRVAAAARGGPAPPPEPVKVVLEDPPAQDCAREAVQRAFEAALETGAWTAVAARGGDARAGWADTPLRALFPGIVRRTRRLVLHGRALLSAGQLGEAQETFAEAARVDPGDPEVQAYLDDVRRSLALSREIEAANAKGDAESLDPRLSPAQAAAAQVALERARRRRQELLATLAVLDEDVHAPPAGALALLRRVEIRQPGAFGPTLARQRAGGAVEARAAYAPNGQILARYYLAPGAPEPLLREEDTDGDGSPDRWITYRGAVRAEIFEAGSGHGRPDRRILFAEDGESPARVEFDTNGDGRPDRVLHYAGDTLLAEDTDTDGDGVLDRFDRFGADGRVEVREEDLDGDGTIDVKSEFRGGRLVKRELSQPQLTPRPPA